MKVLIIRLSSIGDIILTTPVIRALKKQIQADVHFLCKKSFVPLLSEHPEVSKVWSYDVDQPFQDQIKPLKEEQFDHVVDLHRNLRSRRIIRSLGVPSTTFPKLNMQKWLMVNLKWDMLPELHIVDRYLEAIAPLQCRKDQEGLDFYIHPDHFVDLNAHGLQSESYCVFVVGAAHETKQVPIDQAIPLLNQINLPIVLLGGHNDRQKAAELEAELCGQVQNFCGSLSLQESASIIDQSAIVLTPDTGLMHMAAALKKPTIVFWGNTIPDFGMGPYYGDRDIPTMNVEIEGLRCRPCSKIGSQHCPKGHFKCMRHWNPLEIAEKVNSFYRREVLSKREQKSM